MILQRCRPLMLLLLVACGGTDSLLEEGHEAMAAGRRSAAVETFSAALERSPDRADAWLARAEARLSLGENEGALSDLRRAVALDPTLAGAWRLLGKHEPNARDRVEAWSKVVELAPEELEARRERGKAYLDRGATTEAAEDLAAWLEAHPDDEEAHGWYGDALLALDRPYEAIEHFEKGLAPSARVPRAIHRIKQKARTGDTEAVRYLVRHGESTEDFLVMARSLYEGGRLLPAVEEVRKAVAVHKEPASERAQALSLSATIRLAMLDDPAYAATRGATGALERGRVLEEVVRECEESLAIEPSSQCYRTMGKARLELDQPARAIQAFSQAIEVDPDSVETRRLRSAAAEDRERWDLVIEDVDALEAVGPLAPALLVRRGWARANLEGYEPAQARADFDAAVDKAGSSGPALYESLKARGFFLAEQGDKDAAIADLERARSLRPMRDELLEERLAALGVSPR